MEWMDGMDGSWMDRWMVDDTWLGGGMGCALACVEEELGGRVGGVESSSTPRVAPIADPRLVLGLVPLEELLEAGGVGL